MRILLVQPPQITRDVISLYGIEMPLHLTYLASALENPLKTIEAYGHKILKSTKEFAENEKIRVDIIDLQFFKKPLNILKKKLITFEPDVVGITAFTIQAKFVNPIAKIVKDFNANILTVFGGVHASALPQQSLQEMPMIDITIIGEGEITMLEICSFLIQNHSNLSKTNFFNDISNIPGICFRDRNSINNVKFTEPRPLIKNLDLLEFPAREKLIQEKYIPFFVNYWKLPTTGILSSRGCPFNCSYCSKSIYHRSFRFRSPENVLEEMKFCEKKYNIHDFRFFDDAVTTNMKWIGKFSKLLIDSGVDYKWNGFSRVTHVNKSLLKLMKRSGCYHLKFGIESASQDILNKIHKNQSVQQAKKAIKLTNEVGIESLADYILNFPGETIQSMMKTVQFAKRLNSTYAMFFVLKPLPGSEIYDEAKKNGTLIHENWELYGEEDPPILTNQIRDERVKNLLRYAYNQYYLRPNYVLKWIKDIIRERSFYKIRRLIGGIKVFLPK